MSTEIDRTIQAVLKVLYTWSMGESDLNTGRYTIKTDELLAATKLSRGLLEDAVSLLANRGLVETVTTLGGLQEISPTPEGRAYFQGTGQSASDNIVDSTETQMKYDVFLSHSSLDDNLAKDIKKILEANGIFTFATPSSVPTGKWEPQLERALQRSNYIWVLLTPQALRQSVWAHHEFGYFYGYRHGQEKDLEGHTCRFLFTEGTELRGLYGEIQGVQIDSFDDPFRIAQTIGTQIGMPVTKLPDGFVHRKYTNMELVAPPHPTLERLSISGTTSGEDPQTRRVDLQIQSTDQSIYSLSALSMHPEVEWEVFRASDVVAPKVEGEIQLRVRFRKVLLAELPTVGKDSKGRQFDLVPGRRAPINAAPLLLTFEMEDGRALAAVYYYKVTTHQKGFPDIELTSVLPLEWREGSLG